MTEKLRSSKEGEVGLMLIEKLRTRYFVFSCDKDK